jgi:hypothetical protein
MYRSRRSRASSNSCAISDALRVGGASRESGELSRAALTTASEPAVKAIAKAPTISESVRLLSMRPSLAVCLSFARLRGDDRDKIRHGGP